MPSPSHNPHDRFFRSVFSQRELMEEYVRNFLPKELAERFHLDSLVQQKESYLDKNLRQYFSDVIYTVSYGESEVTIALLLEHKSYFPQYPWLQLLQYMVNAFEAQKEQDGFPGQFRPVIPIVIYHGEEKWKIRPASSYFEGMDELLKPFVPEFEYLLNDLSDHSEEELLEMDGSWVKRAFLALKAVKRKPTLKGLSVIFQGLTEQEVNELFSNYIHRIFVYLLQSKISKDIIMRAIDKVDSPAKEQVLTAYDQILQEGEAKGLKVGIEQGMEKGRLEERAKKNFQVFKKGIPLGLSISDLIELTDVDEKNSQGLDEASEG